jgi:hypothetical protein
MPASSYLTSEITIGDLANKIGIASDGSMTFTDFYTPVVKLKDILGGSVVLDPALLVHIENTDASWVSQPANEYGQVFYKITINHNWNLTHALDTNNIMPIGVLVKIFDSNNFEIGVESIRCLTNTIEITVSKKITMKVAVKKIG